MLKIAVCDDEKEVCDEVSGLLGSEYSVTVFGNGAELLTSPNEFDVVLLDIEMPELDGMTAAEKLRRRNKNTYIVFLTNHDEVMREAFKVRAYRFFSKPLDPPELYRVLAEIEAEIYSTVKLSVVSNGVHAVIRLSDVVYLEAYGDGTYIFTKNSFYDTRQQLVYWQKLLDGKGFFQVNRANIIALDKVDSFTCRTVTVRDKDFTISRFKVKEFHAALEKTRVVRRC